MTRVPTTSLRGMASSRVCNQRLSRLSTAPNLSQKVTLMLERIQWRMCSMPWWTRQTSPETRTPRRRIFCQSATRSSSALMLSETVKPYTDASATRRQPTWAEIAASLLPSTVAVLRGRAITLFPKDKSYQEKDTQEILKDIRPDLPGVGVCSLSSGDIPAFVIS
jgi:hypothetical protein